MGLNGLASSVRPWFVEASLTVEKAVSCYKVGWLIASLLSFRNIQLSLAVRKFRAAEKERCEWCHRRVCETLLPDVVSPKAHQNNHSYVSSVDLPSIHYANWWAVTRRTLKNHKTAKIGGWTVARTLRTIRYIRKLNIIVYSFHWCCAWFWNISGTLTLVSKTVKPYQTGWRIACSLPCVTVENSGKDWYFILMCRHWGLRICLMLTWSRGELYPAHTHHSAVGTMSYMYAFS